MEGLQQLKNSITDLTEKLDQARWKKAPQIPIVRIGVIGAGITWVSWMIFGDMVTGYLGKEGAKVSSEILKAPGVKKDATQLVKDVATDPSTQDSLLQLVNQINANPLLMDKLSVLIVSALRNTVEKVKQDPALMNNITDIINHWMKTPAFSQMIQEMSTRELQIAANNTKNQDHLRTYFMSSLDNPVLKSNLARSLREVAFSAVVPSWGSKQIASTNPVETLVQAE
jgi:hypothetical protein